MNTKFNCPRCNSAIEADARKAGMAGDCPACGELLVIPAERNLAPTMAAPAVAPPGEPKTAADYTSDAICATAKAGWKVTSVTAKAGWRAAKFIAPFVRNVARKVTGRAASAAASTKPGKAVVDGAKWLAEPPAKPPSALSQIGKAVYFFSRWFGG